LAVTTASAAKPAGELSKKELKELLAKASTTGPPSPSASL
jgi:hypothetical protein